MTKYNFYSTHFQKTVSGEGPVKSENFKLFMLETSIFVHFFRFVRGKRERVMGDPFSTDPEDIVLPPMNGYEMVMLTGLNYPPAA